MTAAPAQRAGPTLGAALVAPRSLGLLLLALLLAGVFAALGQWQLSRAVEQGAVVERPTETEVPLNRVAEAGTRQTEASVGRRVVAGGRLVPGDTLVAGDRLNDGEAGWWVVGHAVLDDPAGSQLAVALGWAPTREAADTAAASVDGSTRVLRGRYVDSDAAEPTGSGPPTELASVAAARLVNLWQGDTGGPVYEGILTLRDAPAGLTDIYSPRPTSTVEVNLLNILYAGEWTLFAVAALYVWYRLVRDRWEQERAAEPVEDVAADSSA